MKVVVCPDSFKGSLSAKEVAYTISKVLRDKCPNTEILQIPLADGGEGSADIITQQEYPYEIKINAPDPLGRLIPMIFNIDATGKKAFIESARIIGLPLLAKEERNPLIASSFGLGEVIKNAIESNCEEITVSLGGSATCDGGIGMMDALSKVNLQNIRFNIICDVTNPLLGTNGAVKIFAPQKGAKVEDLPVLEKRLQTIVNAAKKSGLYDVIDINKEGAGAAGGLGFAFQTFLKARTFKGIDYVMRIIDFDNKIQGADIIITGEGKIDHQSLMGKVISGVLKSAKRKNIPVFAIGGIVENKDDLIKAGLLEVYEILNSNLSLEENMSSENTKQNIIKTIGIMLKSNIFKQIIL